MNPFKITLTETENTSECAEVIAQLRAFNIAHLGPSRRKGLNLVLRNEAGDLKAGLVGVTYWSWLHVDFLWVDESLRGQGHGAKLLREAEAVAVSRGCLHSSVDTFSFQAPEFYKKMGYQSFGVLNECPVSQQKRYFFYKAIAE